MVMDRFPDHPTDRDPEIPAALARALREVYGAAPTAPAGFDARVREAARARLTRGSARRTMSFRIAAAAGLAAALGVSATIWMAPASSPARVVALGPDDVNRDGRVDVLDAMSVALAIRAGRAGDGVDEADVRRMMARIVSLTSGAGGGHG